MTLREVLYDWFGLNRWLFLAIRSDGSSTLDATMRTVSVLADYRYVPIYLVLGMAIAWGLHRPDARVRREHRRAKAIESGDHLREGRVRCDDVNAPGVPLL